MATAIHANPFSLGQGYNSWPAVGFALWANLRTLLAILSIVLLLPGCVLLRPRDVAARRNIEYARVDGRHLRLDIYMPRYRFGKLPVVLWIYGGGWEHGSKEFCPAAFMAEQNFAVISFNYRLDGVAKFPAQIYDCKAVVRWVRAHAGEYGFDADHIGVVGASAGGHLAALLGTTAGVSSLEGDVGDNLEYSSRVQAVCALYPPTDLDRLVSNPNDRRNPRSVVGKLIGGPVEENLDKARLASPINYVSKDAAPLFLMHGGSDQLVPPEQSQIFYDALKKAGVEAHLVIVPNKGHGISAPPDVAKQIYAFFRAHLQADRDTAAH